MKSDATCPIILLTDFGLDDTYVGVMKGVIHKINPQSTLIDLSHAIEPQNIMQASFLLLTSFPYFPEKSIFCVVVDPGVGSKRKPICIETEHYIFIGPDNGVLYPAAHKDGILRIIHLDNSLFFLRPLSNTFHGRDIFAPVSGALSKNDFDLGKLGTEVNKCVRKELPRIKRIKNRIKLTVLHIDHFGNIILNLTSHVFDQFTKGNGFVLNINTNKITKVCQTYSHAEDNIAFLMAGSSGYMEISLKNGHAASCLNVRLNDKVELEIHASSP